MQAIPEGWPPNRVKTRQVQAPLFPLSDVWLFPGAVLTLHIFEPRYRRMIEDGLDGPGHIVLGTVMQGHEREMEGTPPCYSVAGLGEIGHFERLPDGRFNIFLVGLSRVRIREIDSETPYRQVLADYLEEVQAGPGHETLRSDLEAALEERSEEPLQLPEQMPVGRLADLLTLRLPLAHAEFNKLYSDLDACSRARAVLERHEHHPMPPSSGF